MKAILSAGGALAMLLLSAPALAQTTQRPVPPAEQAPGDGMVPPQPPVPPTQPGQPLPPATPGVPPAGEATPPTSPDNPDAQPDARPDGAPPPLRR